MKEYNVSGHEPSFLPDKGNFKLVWSDEFDGDTLDTSKWDYRLCMMGKRWDAWSDKGVTLDGKSNAVFKIFEENGKIVSSQLQSGYNFMDKPVTKSSFGADTALQWNIGKLEKDKYLKQYGYFECRVRLQQMEGWWSAFWIQSPIIGASLDCGKTGTEIDVMESFHPGVIAQHNLIAGGYGNDSVRNPVSDVKNIENVGEFHRFGVLWDESGYTFYIDGKEDGHSDKLVSHTPEFVLITTEVNGYRKFNENGEATFTPEAVEAAKKGDTFLVDYVRVFDFA